MIFKQNLFIIVLITILSIQIAQAQEKKVPLYQLFNGENDHVLVTSTPTANTYETNGYQDTLFLGFVNEEEMKGQVPIFTLYKEEKDDHVYCTNLEEKDKLIEEGYKDMGILGYAYLDQQAGTIPVYRHFNGQLSDHMYTTDKDTHENLPSLKYGFEKIEFYAYNKDIGEITPLYRHFKPNDHFYTTDKQEHTEVISNGYTDEGIVGYVYKSHEVNTVPLFRLYKQNGDDHFYTINEQEKNKAVSGEGYVFEGIIGYVYYRDLVGTIPVYRHWNPTLVDHFYTRSKTESDNAVTQGWEFEKIEFYFLPNEEVPAQLVPDFIGSEDIDASQEEENQTDNQVLKYLQVHRLFKQNDHIYTVHYDEYKQLKEDGFADEGILGFIYDQQIENTVPLYRLYKSEVNNHFYCIDEEEKEKMLGEYGYKFEGLMGYVYKDNLDETTTGIFQLWNELLNDHLYTNSEEESKSLATQGYREEGISYYLVTKETVQQQIQNKQVTQIDNEYIIENTNQTTETEEPKINRKPFYRLYDNKNNHLYTSVEAERERLLETGQYADEGILGYLFHKRQPDTTVVYRLYNEEINDHFYCVSEQEKEQALENGYKFQSLSGFVYTDPVEGTDPVYRHWNEEIKDHFYTTSKEESDNAIPLGWAYEGIEFHILKNQFIVPQESQIENIPTTEVSGVAEDDLQLDCVTVFSECEFQGEQQEICVKNPKLFKNIKSIFIPDGQKLKLHSLAHFKGQQIIFKESVKCIDQIQFQENTQNQVQQNLLKQGIEIVDDSNNNNDQKQQHLRRHAQNLKSTF